MDRHYTPAILYTTRPSGEVMFDANRVTALNCLNCARLSEAVTLFPLYLPSPPSSLSVCVCPEINRAEGKSRRIPGIVSFSWEDTDMLSYREPVFKEARVPLFGEDASCFVRRCMSIRNTVSYSRFFWWNEIDACAGQDERFI